MTNRTLIVSILLYLVSLCGLQAQMTDSTRIWQKALKGKLSVNNRVRYLNKVAACYWYVNTDSALLLARQGASLMDKSVEPLVRGYNHFVLGVAWQTIGNSDSSFFYLYKALKVFSDNNLDKQKFRAMEQLGENYRIIGKLDSAVALVSRSLEWFRKNNNTQYVISTLNYLGNIYNEQNRNQKALACYLEAESIIAVMGDTSTRVGIEQGIGNIYINLGNLYSEINPPKARDYFQMSLVSFTRGLELNETKLDFTGICFSKANMISALISLGKFASADSLLSASTECLDNRNSRVRMSLEFFRARIAYEKKQYGVAGNRFQKILNDTNATVVLPYINDTKMFLAAIEWEKSKNGMALNRAREVYRDSRAMGNLNFAYSSARFLSEHYLESGLRDSSVHYMALAGVLKDSLVNRAGRENMDELEMKYKSSLRDQQLKLLQSEKENERRRSVIIFISSTFLLVILLLVTIMLWLRQKRLRIINQSAITSKKLAENEVLLKEVEMEKLGLQKLLDEQEIARLNSDLDKKQQDIVFQSLMKANTNNVLKTVTESLSRFSIHLSRKKEQEEFNQMIFQLGKGLTSSPLEDFEQLFKELHPSFYSNLCSACPGLSQNDLMLCAFIRLNLSSKDIANIINLSLSSIETSRSRLRKKLGLDAGDSLTSFLMNF